jgi:predicted RNA-binding Zn-ribbon protein involved in translation (DUF1610 family)
MLEESFEQLSIKRNENGDREFFELVKHLRGEEKNPNFRCPRCGSTEYSRRREWNGLELSRFVCEGCGVSFDDPERFSKALKPNFHCPVCGCSAFKVFYAATGYIGVGNAFREAGRTCLNCSAMEFFY